MIREATREDVPDVLALVHTLHASTRMALPIDDMVARRSLMAMQASPSGLLLVAEESGVLRGFLAAAVSYAAISMTPIAAEVGWYSEGGAGLRLLARYEQWAAEQGCAFIRMSTPPHNDRAASLLERRGYTVSELAWVKAL